MTVENTIPGAALTSHDMPKTSSEVSQLIAHTKRELPLLTPDVIRGVEALDEVGSSQESSRYTTSQVVNVLGTFAGIKPVSLITRDASLSNKADAQFSDAMSKMGLTEVPFINPNGGALLTAVSRHKELATALRDEFWGDFESDAAQYRIGALLGYPESATDHYIWRLNQEKMTGKLPEGVNHGGKRAFTQFVLSPDNYEQELQAYSKPLEEVVSTMLPKTYSRIENQANQKSKASKMKNILGKMRKKQS